jgi:AbiV family abortive infection protein
MSRLVTSQSLLHGAVYSLEQCGLLLRDAILLYDKGSYATALALAAFAREELGRWLILLELHTQVVAGKRLSVKDVETECDDHVSKQRAGMTSLTQYADNNSEYGKVLRDRAKASPAVGSAKSSTRELTKSTSRFCGVPRMIVIGSGWQRFTLAFHPRSSGTGRCSKYRKLPLTIFSSLPQTIMGCNARSDTWSWNS